MSKIVKFESDVFDSTKSLEIEYHEGDVPRNISIVISHNCKNKNSPLNFYINIIDDFDKLCALRELLDSAIRNAGIVKSKLTSLSVNIDEDIKDLRELKEKFLDPNYKDAELIADVKETFAKLFEHYKHYKEM